MLEFVSLSGNDDGKDEQTRRKVRSQAMRDFRRRQRAEREASQGRDAENPPTSKKSARIHWPSRERSSPAIKSSTVDTPIVNSISPGVFDSFESSTRPASLRLREDSCDSATPPLPEPFSQPKLQRAHSDSFQSLFQLPKRSSSITDNLSQWPTATDDTFDSPAQISQMSAFCKSYIHWLRPGVDPETANKVLSQAWEVSQCPMLLAACCLASVGHLDAVQPQRPGGNHAVYKARILREVSKRMRSPTLATSDETIGTLGCLLSFEMSRGSGEALTHLRGLKSIINMKGGMNALALTGISMMLETMDLLYAVIFDAQPVLTVPEPGMSTSIFTDFQYIDRDKIVETTPVLLLAEQETFQRRPTPYTRVLQLLPELMRCCIRVLADALIDDETSKPGAMIGDAVEKCREILNRFGRVGFQESSDAQDAHHLARACYLGFVIKFNLLVNKIPQRHLSNQGHADGLFHTLRNIGESTWHGIPYLRLVMQVSHGFQIADSLLTGPTSLLTGAAASSDVTRKSFFKAQLVRCIYQMGNSEWRRVKRFMLVYLEITNALEKPERRATPPLDFYANRNMNALYSDTNWLNSGRPNSTLGGGGEISGQSNLYSTTGPRPYMDFPTQPTPYNECNVDPFLRYDG